MTSLNYRYFMVVQKPAQLSHLKPGRICYVSEHRYSCSQTSGLLQVVPLGARTPLDHKLELSSLKELRAEEAGLLLAVPEDAERLKMSRDGEALQTALGLTVGTAVTVEEGGVKLKGAVRYVGPRDTTADPVAATYFGIELQGADRGKGVNDGSVGCKHFFTCDRKCGVFAPFFRVRPLVPASLSPPPQLQTEELQSGDRVTYFVGDECRHGMVVNVHQDTVRISTDTDETGKRGGEVQVPLDSVAKGEVPAGLDVTDMDTSPAETHTGLHMDLNSMVEVTLSVGNSYGIIRWIGILPGRADTMVGLELEDNNGVSDGTFKGQRLFQCPPKRALFVKLNSCRPDSRFQNHNAPQPANQNQNRLELDNQETGEGCSPGALETLPPISTEQVHKLLIGRMKGIQGHCNSCYMDAALFGLFSCSSVLDSMLFKSTTAEDVPIQRTLLRDIVAPLRSKGFVEGRHIMKLRQLLQNLGYSRSFTTDEKDPEEFLIVIMHHILALDPLLKLSAAGKVQESYCYQIFLDQNHSLVLPTVQQLLEHSFHSSGLKLAEVPSCLILQMPRFGKKFKMFDKIIPSVELDITDLLCEGPQQCMLCGKLAVEECADCFKDPVFSSTGFKIFCKTCSDQVHAHPHRRSHQPAPLDIPKGYLGRGVPHSLTRDRLELFAVLCIETSHYVSFVKHGPRSQDWIFFDSMADREGETDGYNIPEVRACPEVGEYLEMSPAELANQVPRDMKGVAKRLFCDAYMFLYQSTSMCLYR